MTLRTRSFALAVLLAGAVTGAVAQIPNAGFENWTDNEPDHWLTNNFPGTPTVTPSTDARTGSLAARGEVVSVFEFPLAPNLVSADSNGLGFPVSQRWAELRGWYKFTTEGADRVLITVLMTSGDTAIGAGGIDLGPAAAYTAFSAPISYIPAITPDSAYITITIVGDTLTGLPTLGSVFLIDDLSFSGVSSVETGGAGLPDVPGLAQNFPNPFNPSTRIGFRLPEGGSVRLAVFDLLGREVAVLAEGPLPAGDHVREFTPEGLASGVYLYRLTANGTSIVRRMLLLR